MRRTLYPRQIIFALLICALPVIAAAQNPQNPPPDQGPQEARFGQPGEQRPNLFMELGLTQDQVRSLRRINAERKPAEMAARKRFQDANRALNMAIYGDAVDDADFQTRLTECQSAQAELARIKFTNELAIRRLLTPAQLQKFRELRRRFAEGRGRRADERIDRGRVPQMRRDMPMRPPPIN